MANRLISKFIVDLDQFISPSCSVQLRRNFANQLNRVAEFLLSVQQNAFQWIDDGKGSMGSYRLYFYLNRLSFCAGWNRTRQVGS